MVRGTSILRLLALRWSEGRLSDIPKSESLTFAPARPTPQLPQTTRMIISNIAIVGELLR